MTESDLNQYLAMLDKKSLVYRAERAINPGSQNAEHNLKKLDRMAIEGMAKFHQPKLETL